MDAITVKAAPNLRVPYEENGRKYISDDAAVTVERSAYYLRRLADGDLIEVAAAATPQRTEQAEQRTNATTRPAARKGA